MSDVNLMTGWAEYPLVPDWQTDRDPPDGRRVVVRWRQEGGSEQIGIAYMVPDGSWVRQASDGCNSGICEPPDAWCPFPRHRVAVAGSWRQRNEVRRVAEYLRAALGTSVYDFTDPACRLTPEIPPEANRQQWRPSDSGTMLVPDTTLGPDSGKVGRLTYEQYLRGLPGVESAILCNHLTYSTCRACVLVLPAGCDAHFDFGCALASGAVTVVYGHPRAGDRHPSNLCADHFVQDGDLDGLATALRQYPHVCPTHWQAVTSAAAMDAGMSPTSVGGGVE